MTQKKPTAYPDISDVLRKKEEIRRYRASRPFGEKIEAMEALRERLRPFKEARERRKAERQHKTD
jgi:hypothetical protein